MVTLEWHPNAIEDLHLIFNYITQDSQYYVNIIIQKIKNHVIFNPLIHIVKC